MIGVIAGVTVVIIAIGHLSWRGRHVMLPGCGVLLCGLGMAVPAVEAGVAAPAADSWDAREVVLQWIAAARDNDLQRASAYVVPGSPFDLHADKYLDILTHPLSETNYSEWDTGSTHHDNLWKAHTRELELSSGATFHLVFHLRGHDDRLKLEDVRLTPQASVFETSFGRSSDEPLQGRLLNDLGVPVAGAELRSISGNWSATTDEQGEFPLVKGVRAIRISAAGHIPVSRQEVYGPQDSRYTTTFVIRRSASLRGRVLGTDGEPFADARVVTLSGVLPLAGTFHEVESRYAVESRPNGKFTVDGVTPGNTVVYIVDKNDNEYDDVVKKGDGRPRLAIKHLNLSESETAADVVFDFRESTHSLTGTVTSTDGRPVPGAAIHLWFADADAESSEIPVIGFFPATADHEGRYQIHHLPAGKWKLSASLGRAYSEALSVDFADGSVPPLVVPIAQTAEGFTRRPQQNLGPVDVVVEWINATVEGDTTSAATLTKPGSPFAERGADHIEAFSFANNPRYIYPGGPWRMEPIDDDRVLVIANDDYRRVGPGFGSRIQFALSRSGSTWQIYDVILDRGRSLFAPEADESANSPPMGKVVDGAGNAVARVTVRQKGGTWSAMSDEQGRFELPLGGREITLNFQADGFTHVQYQYGNPYLDQREEWVYEIHRQASISGQVIGLNGKPLANVALFETHIQTYPSDRVEHSMNLQRAATDAHGKFYLIDVPAGIAVIHCQVIADDGKTYLALQKIAVDEGHAIRDLTLDLRDSTHTLHGTVVDMNNLALPDSSVQLSVPVAGTAIDLNIGELFPVPCDGEGHFQVMNLPAGEWTLRGRFQNYDGPGVNVNLADGQNVVISMLLHRTADGFIRQLPHTLDPAQAVLEWIHATRDGDTAGASAFVVDHSPFAQYASAYESILSFHTDPGSVVSTRVRNDGDAIVYLKEVDISAGIESKLGFHLRRQNSTWKIENVTINGRHSLFTDRPTGARLKTGVQVEAAGVSNSFAEGATWWSVNGTPIRGHVPIPTFPDVTTSGDERMIGIAFTVARSGPLGIHGIWELDTRAMKGTSYVMADPEFAIVGLACVVLPDILEMSARFGIATGPWTTAAEVKAVESDVSVEGEQPVFMIDSLSDFNGKTRVIFSHTLPNADVRIVAVGTDGNTSIPSMDDALALAVGERKQYQLIVDRRVEDLSLFQLRMRPYEWIEFHNISLEPGHITQPAARLVAPANEAGSN